jgi:DNA-binding transcriptional LysR family regulator
VARRSLFSGIPEFLAVAELGSFRAAAVQLRVTPGAVSQAVKALEDQVGLPLFLRTTRSVGLTEAGTLFLAQLRPATAEIRQAVDGLEALRGRPVGTLRLSVPRIALETVVYPVLPEFRRRHPEIGVEVEVDDASIDLSSGGYDAGIRLGEFIERDMIAVKLTPDFRWIVVGAPCYFESRGWPRRPQDLTNHECIRYRFPSARTVYRWEFVEDGRRFSLDPPGRIMVTDHLAMNAIAIRGLGLAYTADIVAAGDRAAGRLISVLGDYMPTTAGLYLYFPERSRDQLKLRAFITVATELFSRANRLDAPPPATR